METTIAEQLTRCPFQRIVNILVRVSQSPPWISMLTLNFIDVTALDSKYVSHSDTFVGVGFLYIWEKHCNYMDEVYLIMKEEWGNDKAFTYINELVGMYNTEKEALSDVDRIVKETLGCFTEEEAKRYRVTTDIKKMNEEEEFCNHEDDGVFVVAEIISKDHGFNFPLFRLDVPFKGRLDLLFLERKD